MFAVLHPTAGFVGLQDDGERVPATVLDGRKVHVKRRPHPVNEERGFSE